MGGIGDTQVTDDTVRNPNASDTVSLSFQGARTIAKGSEWDSRAQQQPRR